MKSYKAVFSINALQDINEARSWYNLQQKGLGKRLVADAKNIIASIKQNP
jgi:inhibitor of KinA sporulation pathway (predicted exonuclease)